jgi:hypothetical protein
MVATANAQQRRDNLNAMRAKLGLVAAGVLLLATLTGCSATVALTPAHDDTNPLCGTVVALLPSSVSGLAQRLTNAQGTGAWGPKPDIYLKCGVPVPDPTAKLQCVTVQGIDWLYDPRAHNTFIFTTYGRNPAVSVYVNSSNPKADGNQALTDLADSVAPIKAKHRCEADQDLENDHPVDTPTPTPTPTN